VLLGGLRDVFVEFTSPGSPHRLPVVAQQLRMLHLQELGFLYGVLQLVTLWDLHWLLALEEEVKRDPRRFARLAGALADLEAHVALATYAAEQAGTCWPDILAEPSPRLEIESGEHPLLAFGTAVPNDVRLADETRVAIVTGSNMSGKSTFLRMVALNVVLAQIGVPVRARGMRLVPLTLHAHIHVRDSLADGKSTFLVEVERVHEILAAAQSSARMLGILDELFRGTNSRERLAASREIARHLAASGGLFLIATHDQELARLAVEDGVSGLFAVHFRDTIVDGRMVFPYTVEPGIASSTNAIRMLEIAGYPPELVRRARAAAESAEPG
jgi:DNA mismatch repair ATPase MutS